MISERIIPCFRRNFKELLLFQWALNIEKRHFQKFLRRIVYFIGMLFVPLCFLPVFVESAVVEVGFPHYYMGPGHYYHLFVAFFMSVVITIHILMFRAYLRETPSRKVQITYLFGSYAIGYAGGVAVFLPYYGIRLPAFALYSIPACHLAIAYSILRYRFMDIRLLIREWGQYAITGGLIGLFVSYLSYFFINDIKSVLLIFSVCFCVPFIHLRLTRWLNVEISRRGLLGKKEIEKVRSLTDRIQEAGYKIFDLADTVTQVTLDEIPSNMCAMLVIDHDKGVFVLESQVGMKNKFMRTLSVSEPLIQYLTEHHEILVKSEAERFLSKEVYGLVAKIFDDLEAEVCAPLFVLDQLAGVLVLGPKADKRPYFVNEINRLSSIAMETATSLRYALAVSKAATETKRWAHSLNQALKPLSQGLDILADVDPTIESNPNRAKVYARMRRPLKRLGDFLHYLTHQSRIIDEALRNKYERNPVDISEIVKRSLTTYKISLEKKNTHISTVLYTQNLRIDGHMRDLISVFEVLFGNAIRYLGEGGHITVTGFFENGFYKIHVENDGPVIPPQHLEDVFTEGFQIKDGLEGSGGLGLANARRIVEMHGGKIRAENTGTTHGIRFIIELPAKQETVSVPQGAAA